MVQNYFKWKDNKYFDPKDHYPSALFADIYLLHFEQYFILNAINHHYHKIQFYRRYVDDSLIILQGTNRQGNIFVNI